VLVVVPGFLALGWWQAERALGGNTLSWAYAFEWPLLAGYGVYLWWDLVHDRREAPPELLAAKAERDPIAEREEAAERARRAAEDDEADPEMAAYNRYLAELAASDHERRR